MMIGVYRGAIQRQRQVWLTPLLLALAVLTLAQTAAPPAQPAQPAQYQVMRIRFQVLDLDGRPLEGSIVAARLDSASTRMPPDKPLKVKSGDEEFIYGTEEQYPIFSTKQTASDDGFAEVPFIVYANRSDPIDYQLSVAYKGHRKNYLVAQEQARAVSMQDSNATYTLHADVRREVKSTHLIVAIVAWLGVTAMGFLLFMSALYPRWLKAGKPIDLARALCWSGVIFVSLAMLGIVYWWLFPHFINAWVFFGALIAIWLIHLLATVLPQRA
jgi:hypothetical protein